MEEEPQSLQGLPPIPADRRGSLNPKTPTAGGSPWQQLQEDRSWARGDADRRLGRAASQPHTPGMLEGTPPIWALSRSPLPSHTAHAKVLGPPMTKYHEPSGLNWQKFTLSVQEARSPNQSTGRATQGSREVSSCPSRLLGPQQCPWAVAACLQLTSVAPLLPLPGSLLPVSSYIKALGAPFTGLGCMFLKPRSAHTRSPRAHLRRHPQAPPENHLAGLLRSWALTEGSDHQKPGASLQRLGGRRGAEAPAEGRTSSPDSSAAGRPLTLCRWGSGRVPHSPRPAPVLLQRTQPSVTRVLCPSPHLQAEALWASASPHVREGTKG